MFYGTSQAKREGSMMSNAQDVASTAKEEVVAAAQEVLSQAQEKLESLAKQGKAVGKEVDQFTREHTWGAVAVAAAVGLAMGILISRDRR